MRGLIHHACDVHEHKVDVGYAGLDTRGSLYPPVSLYECECEDKSATFVSRKLLRIRIG